MRAVDIDVHRGETISKTLSDKALRRQVITFIKLVTADDVRNARIAFQTRRMQRDPIENVFNTTEAPHGILHSHTADKSVHLVAKRQKVFRQIASILAGDSRDKRSLIVRFTH